MQSHKNKILLCLVYLRTMWFLCQENYTQTGKKKHLINLLNTDHEIYLLRLVKIYAMLVHKMCCVYSKNINNPLWCDVSFISSLPYRLCVSVSYLCSSRLNVCSYKDQEEEHFTSTDRVHSELHDFIFCIRVRFLKFLSSLWLLGMALCLLTSIPILLSFLWHTSTFLPDLSFSTHTVSNQERAYAL